MSRRSAVTAAVLAAAALLVASPRPAAAAGSARSSLSVEARVLGVCTITAASMGFPDYDPSAAADTDSLAASLSVRCTNGTSFRVALDAGEHVAGTATRRMSNGATVPEFLTYEIFSDSTRTTVWADGSTQTASIVAPGLSTYTIPVYGRITAGQNVTTGTYKDTVTMTVNF